MTQTQLSPIQKKVLYKLSLIQKLQKAELAKYPTFTAYVDGGDTINLDDATLLSFETIEKLILFCKENNCTFGIISSAQEHDIRSGFMRVEIYPKKMPNEVVPDSYADNCSEGW